MQLALKVAGSAAVVYSSDSESLEIQNETEK